MPASETAPGDCLPSSPGTGPFPSGKVRVIWRTSNVHFTGLLRTAPESTPAAVVCTNHNTDLSEIVPGACSVNFFAMAGLVTPRHSRETCSEATTVAYRRPLSSASVGCVSVECRRGPAQPGNTRPRSQSGRASNPRESSVFPGSVESQNGP
jgi:hypothetical protein